MGLLPDTQNCGLRMRRECRERFLRVRDPDRHHDTCVTHVPWCMPGTLTSGFLWSRWHSRHSRRMRNPQFYVSGKRPMGTNRNSYLGAIHSSSRSSMILHIYSEFYITCVRNCGWISLQSLFWNACKRLYQCVGNNLNAMYKSINWPVLEVVCHFQADGKDTLNTMTS